MEIAGFIVSFVELIIEFIFCSFVIKEFKMTKKSFEWMKKEQQKNNDKEANRQLYHVIKYFILQYFYILELKYKKIKEEINIQENLLKISKSLCVITKMINKEYKNKIDYIKDLKKNIRMNKKIIGLEYKNKIQKLIHPKKDEKDKIIEYILEEYKKKYNKNINMKEKNTIKKILKKFVIIDEQNHIMIDVVGQIYCENRDRLIEKIIKNQKPILPEAAKHANIDYNALEKIYNTILYDYYSK